MAHPYLGASEKWTVYSYLVTATNDSEEKEYVKNIIFYLFEKILTSTERWFVLGTDQDDCKMVEERLFTALYIALLDERILVNDRLILNPGCCSIVSWDGG